MVEQAKADDWRLTEGLIDCATKPFQGIGASKLSEDAFQRQRRAEGASSSSRMSSLRLWMTMVDRQVLSNVHRFQEVAHQHEKVHRGVAHMEPSKFHKPVADGCGAYAKFKGAVAKTPWYSPQPLHFFGNLGDCSLADECRRTGNWAQASKSWLSLLLNGEGVWIRKRGSLSDFYLARNSATGLATQGWPLRAVTVGGRVVYMLKQVSSVKECPYLHIYELDSWEAFSFTWVGMLRQRASFNMDGGGLAMLPDSAPARLLRCVALRGFWQLPKTPLVQLAKELGCPLPESASLLRIVSCLVKWAAPDIADNDLLCVLRLRTRAEDTLQEFVEFTEVEEPPFARFGFGCDTNFAPVQC